MRQSSELQSVSAISHKEKMKKETEQKNAKQEFMVEDLVLVDNSGVPCLPGKLKSKWTCPYLITQVFPHGEVELKAKEGVRFKRNRDRIKLYFKHTTSGNEVIEHTILMKSEHSRVPSCAVTLNQALVGRQPNTYSLFSNSSIFILMSF